MDSQTTAIAGGAAMCASIVCIVALTMYYATGTKAPGDDADAAGGGSSGSGPSGPGKPLPIPEIKKGGPWNIVSITNQQRISSDGKTVKISYVTKEQGMSSGAAFRAILPGLPATSATFSYSVFFARDFEWNKGGKLPGFCIGTSPTGDSSCATGGDWKPDAGSFRVMFRQDGQAIGYAYFPLNGANLGSYAQQGAAYKAVAEASQGNTGHDIWFRKDRAFKLTLNAWNSISISVTLNTPGKNDGSVSATVNGVTRKIDGMVWRKDPKVKIAGLEFVSFYGGGDLSWQCKKCVPTLYRDFRYSAKA